MAPSRTESTPARDPEIAFWANREFARCQQAARIQHAREQRRKVQECVEHFAARTAGQPQQVAA